jgi:phage shock protein PspC (stress-responsive transcriptional regulator)
MNTTTGSTGDTDPSDTTHTGPAGGPGYDGGSPDTGSDTPEYDGGAPSAAYGGPGYTGGRSLSRPTSGRMLAGVAAGLARYLGVDVTLVRIGLAVLTVVGGAGVPLYLAGWLLIPEDGREHSMAAEFLQSGTVRAR